MNNLSISMATDSDRSVATASHAEWLDPLVFMPPRGTDILIFTAGGVAVRGMWTGSKHELAWSPFPRKPNWLKKRLEHVSISPNSYNHSTKQSKELST